MRTKMFFTVMAVAAGAALGGSASAGAVGSLGTTEVTIETQNGDFFGTVVSSDPDSCAEGRTVKLFKLVGDTPDPKVDHKIASDTASLNGDEYQWSTGNTGLHRGRYYARAGKTDFCRGDNSPVVKASSGF